ncbi:MAG: hypothetical protein JXA53_00440 [Bacteroidales bacterium]|nr:hypothetical protein [Bacteroidales bacterium]
MAVKYNVIEKSLPSLNNQRQVKYYAVANANGRVGLPEMTKYIESISTVSGADIRAMLYAMEDFIITSLADGKIVELGELGNIKIRLNSKGEESSDKVSNKTIKKVRAVFSAGKRLRDSLGNILFQKSK